MALIIGRGSEYGIQFPAQRLGFGGYDQRFSIAGWAATTGPSPEIDSAGRYWVLDKVTGWQDSLPVRAGAIDKPGQDGSWDVPPLFGSRVVELAGTMVAQTREGLMSATEQLYQLLSRDDRVDTLVVQEPGLGLSRQIDVRLAGATMIERTNTFSFKFSLSLFSSDVARYSTALHTASTYAYTSGIGRTYNLTFNRVYGSLGSSGLITVNNNGSLPTYPFITIVGPGKNPMVRLSGGDYVSVNVNILTGQTLTIDMAKEEVRLNGSLKNELMVYGSRFFSLPPGTSLLYFTAESGTPLMTVTWRDAS